MGNDEIAPMKPKSRKVEIDFNLDEHPRPKTTLEQMAKLPAVFKKGGVVTAASASGICDGAAAVIIASEEAVDQLSWVLVQYPQSEDSLEKLTSKLMTLTKLRSMKLSVPKHCPVKKSLELT